MRLRPSTDFCLMSSPGVACISRRQTRPLYQLRYDRAPLRQES
jgi:hypothetical protein